MAKKPNPRQCPTGDSTTTKVNDQNADPIRKAPFTDPIPLKDPGTNQPTEEEYQDLGAGE